MELLNVIFLELSFWSVLLGVVWVFYQSFRKLGRKELWVFFLILVGAVLLRLQYGLFAPWHPHDHYVEIIGNLKNNLLAGNFFRVDSIYQGSGGLYEYVYQKILFLFPGFHVYYVYYLSIALHILAGSLLFAFVKDYFRNVKLAHLAFLVFATLPVLVKVSATENMFVVNALTMLVFANILLYIWRNPAAPVSAYVLLFFLFCANLLGRKEYLVFFPLGMGVLVLGLLVFSSPIRQRLKQDAKLIALILLSIGFFGLLAAVYVFPNLAVGMSAMEFSAYKRINTLLSFQAYDQSSLLPYLNSYFTPWYFFLFFVVSPFFLFLRDWRYLWLFLLNILFLVFLIPRSDYSFANGLRIQMPFIFWLIPVVAYGISMTVRAPRGRRSCPMLAGSVILLLTIPNLSFLETTTARKIEQDLLLKHLEQTAPSGSLVLTVAEKKYSDSRFSQTGSYSTQQHGLEFPSYLLPADKKLAVMDIRKEYDAQVVQNYSDVYYYKSLYSHHEEGRAGEGRNGGVDAPQATRQFEAKADLKAIEQRTVRNIGFDSRSVNNFKRGYNGSVISGQKKLKIGWYAYKGTK